MLALLVLLAQPPAVPAEVMRCIEQQKMWVAAPEFFEAITLESGERAYQILDRHQGRTGHLLVVPSSCRIVVFIRPGEVLSPSAGTPPTVAELRSLLKWAGYREVGSGPLGRRTFRVARDDLWFFDGTTVQRVDLARGEVQRVDVSPSSLDQSQ